MQEIPAGPALGQHLTFEALVKTSGVAGQAGLWMRVDGSGPTLDGEPDVLAFYNMSDRPLVGSQDWTRREVTLDVPSDAARIAFGLWLDGPGTVWLDGPALESCGDAADGGLDAGACGAPSVR